MNNIWDLLNEVLRRALFLPEQASTYAREMDSLHYLEMTSMVGLTVLVGAVAIWFCWRYRRRQPRERTPRIVAPLHLEVLVYGGILAFFIMLWVIGFRQYLAIERPPPGSIEVYVTGKQWMWQFGYPEANVGSVGVMYAPAGRAVRLMLTSRDVIHSFFVPDLRLKRDAVPGMFTSIWFEVPEPGRHRILCAELCGVGHSQMLGELIVLPPDRFEAWLDNKRRAAEGQETGGIDLVERGRAAAARNGCLSCHSIGGPTLPIKMIGPSWVGLYASKVELVTGEAVIADEAYLTRSMMDPTAQIVAGFAPVMPTYQGQLEPAEVAAILEFIKSLGDGSSPEELPLQDRLQ